MVKSRSSGDYVCRTSVVRIATGRAITQFDSVRAIAVFSVPVLGFLPFGRCRVVPFLCDLQRLCALVFGQSSNLLVDRRTEAFDVVVVRQSAPLGGLCGFRLAESPPSGFIQSGARGIASDGGHDGDLQKGAEASPAWGRNPGGWMKDTADAAPMVTQVAVRPGGSTPAS
nr:hypothetical protein [Serratia marcescens]